MLLRRFRLVVLCLSAAVLFAILPAHASTVPYTDPALWLDASTGTTLIDFSGLAPAGSFKDYSSPTGYAIDGLNFVGQLTSSTNMLKVMDQNDAAPYFNWGVAATLESPIYSLPSNPSFIPYIRVTLPAGTTAISAWLGTVSPNGMTYQVTLFDGEVFTVATGARPNLTFFGVTAADPIAYADFTLLNPGVYSDSYGVMANFQFGSVKHGDDTGGTGGGDTQTPEASTLILIGSGLVGLRAFRKHWPALGA